MKAYLHAGTEQAQQAMVQNTGLVQNPLIHVGRLASNYYLPVTSGMGPHLVISNHRCTSNLLCSQMNAIS